MSLQGKETVEAINLTTEYSIN